MTTNRNRIDRANATHLAQAWTKGTIREQCYNETLMAWHLLDALDELAAVEKEREELKLKLAREDRAHEITIGQRDAFEEFIGDMAHGFEPDAEWSNLCDLRDVVSDGIDELRARLASAEMVVEAAKKVDAERIDVQFFDSQVPEATLDRLSDALRRHHAARAALNIAVLPDTVKGQCPQCGSLKGSHESYCSQFLTALPNPSKQTKLCESLASLPPSGEGKAEATREAVSKSDVRPLSEDEIHNLACEISHDIRCAVDESTGLNRVRWNNRAVGCLVRTVNDLTTQLSASTAREAGMREALMLIANTPEGHSFYSLRDGDKVHWLRSTAVAALSTPQPATPQDTPPDSGAGGEVERLRAVVSRLPKTADGVPITPGMGVWYSIDGSAERVCEWPVFGVEATRLRLSGTLFSRGEDCYSTRAAADSAATQGEVGR